MYTLSMNDGVSTEIVEIEDLEEATIQSECEEWVKGGEWGDEGASISVGWTVENEEGSEVDCGCITVDVDPHHSKLIAQSCIGGWGRDKRRARLCGFEPEEHEWTSEGEGGLDENPGVWSTGGTSMRFKSHCKVCGLHRKEYHCGSQRNPGEHDTVKYTMPDSWCEDCQKEECDCVKEEE